MKKSKIINFYETMDSKFLDKPLINPNINFLIPDSQNSARSCKIYYNGVELT